MKRRKLSDGEYDQVQRLRNENKKLKHQISQLRKQMSRIDVDRFQNLKEVIEAQERQDRVEQQEAEDKALAQKWECWECKQGTLRLTVLERLDGVFYYRKCDTQGCRKRTKLQRYNKDVEGLK
jgi:predicted RNase H-like nuclease (RuvC/YqgF family)